SAHLLVITFTTRLIRVFVRLPPSPTYTLFPYTTLFRSPLCRRSDRRGVRRRGRRPPDVRRADLLRLAPRAGGRRAGGRRPRRRRSEEHTSELQSPDQLVCRLLLAKKNET